MTFLDILTDFLDGKITQQELKDELSVAQVNIWKSGLTEDEFHICVQLFLESDLLCHNTRALLLQCLVPTHKIPEGSLKALLAWYFSNYFKNIEDAVCFLRWLCAMLANNFIDSAPVERRINQFLMSFYFEELVAPVCSVLSHIIKPGNISAKSIFIAKYFYELPLKFNGKGKIACLLRLFHASSPSLIPNPPPGKTVIQDSIQDFEKCVSLIALRNGFVNTLPLNKKSNSLSFQACGTSKSNIHMAYANSEVVTFLQEIKSMPHLGLMINKKKLPPLQSICSLVGSKAGQIYLCWKAIVGNDFPTEDKHTIIPVLGELFENCKRIRNSVPGIPKILSEYFISWDGVENERAVYGVLPWIHFESFEELYANVLCHLVNLFFTGTLKDKISILDCLTDLIICKVIKIPRETSIKLIILVSRLIKNALAADGIQSTALLLSCLRFYKCISHLEERYMLARWTIPPPFLVFGAFFSRNHIVVSEICHLIVRHNTVMYPLFISLGLIEDFREEEEVVKTYLNDLYLFLWKGQASRTELIGFAENEYLWFSKEVDSAFMMRTHYAIEPLVSYMASQLGRDSYKCYKDKSLLKLLDQFASGISAVKYACES